MNIKRIIFAAMALMLMGSVQAYADDDEMIYGRELMTEQERQEHRQKMRSLQSDEREAYRKEQHERMEERAKERGVEIPDQPAERGQGMRRDGSQGMQQGMGRGGGGQGMGRGR